VSHPLLSPAAADDDALAPNNPAMAGRSSSWPAHLMYRVDLLLSFSGSARFIALGTVSAVLVLLCGLLAFVVVPDVRLSEALWWSLVRFIDTGRFGDESSRAVRAVAFLSTVGGLVVLASLVGLVSSAVTEKLDDLRRGTQRAANAVHCAVRRGISTVTSSAWVDIRPQARAQCSSAITR
jgi:hypothetical protein